MRIAQPGYTAPKPVETTPTVGYSTITWTKFPEETALPNPQCPPATVTEYKVLVECATCT